jgi:hypothetical protein
LALRHAGAVQALLLWWPSGGRPGAEQLAELYYGQYVKAAQQGGMAAVAETPYYTDRIARHAPNRERLLELDLDEFIAVQSRWRQFFLDGADMPVIGVPESTLRELTLPTCVIPGNDIIHPREIAEWLSRVLPNAEFHDLPPLERPQDEQARQQARLDHQLRLADIFLGFLTRHFGQPT